MNLPGVIVDLPTLTKKDEEDLIKWGCPNDIDFIAASFVRKGADLDNIHRVSSNFPGSLRMAHREVGHLTLAPLKRHVHLQYRHGSDEYDLQEGK